MRFLKHWLLTLGVCAVPVGIVLLIIWHDWVGIAAIGLLFVTMVAVGSYEDGEYHGW